MRKNGYLYIATPYFALARHRQQTPDKYITNSFNSV